MKTKYLSKSTVLFLSLIVFILSCNNDDAPKSKMRYFQFIDNCLTSEGQQNSFCIAATNDPKVIKQCLDQLALPVVSRVLFPFGDIEKGNSGYNFNGDLPLNWHYIEDAWEMVDVGIEIYDGCIANYEDDYFTQYGRYGGWGTRIVKEIENPFK